MSYTTIAVIYNPNSTGSSKAVAQDFADEITARLPKQTVELLATERAGHAEELAYSIANASTNPLIISSSGDGGYNEVVNGALKAQKEGRRVTTGVLPAGNANDHHRNLHDEDFIDVIVSGNVKHIDVLKLRGIVNGQPVERYAHSYMGIGLTPKVSHELNKTKLNFLNEIILVARVLFLAKSTKLKVGKKIQHYDSIIFSNVDTMSKYLKVSQSSSTTDGKFEVTIFKRRNKIKLIGVLLRASLIGLKEDQQVTNFSLGTINKTLVQTDGEVILIDAKALVSVSIEQQILACVV